MSGTPMDGDSIDEVNAYMNRGFAKFKTTSGSSDSSSSEYEALSDTRNSPLKLLETMTRWGREQTQVSDSMNDDEQSRGLGVRCGQCSDHRCRGGIACVNVVGSLHRKWADILREWGGDKWQERASARLMQWLINNDGESMPSKVEELKSKTMTQRGNESSCSDPLQTRWEVFIARLTATSEITGASHLSNDASRLSNHRLWLVRFVLKHWLSPWKQALVDNLQEAWEGFAIISPASNHQVDLYTY
jgi:hypothetical protein